MSDYSKVKSNITDRLNLKDTKNIDEFTNKVAEIESSGGKNTTSKISSAKGIFQFLTEGKGNAFQTGLNRLERHLGKSEWIKKAREHNDPNLLSKDQQKALFLANLYEQKGTDEYLKKISEGNSLAMAEAYSKFHHTVEDIYQDPRISKIFNLTPPTKDEIALTANTFPEAV
jgi:hypothetical protein